VHKYTYLPWQQPIVFETDLCNTNNVNCYLPTNSGVPSISRHSTLVDSLRDKPKSIILIRLLFRSTSIRFSGWNSWNNGKSTFTQHPSFWQIQHKLALRYPNLKYATSQWDITKLCGFSYLLLNDTQSIIIYFVYLVHVTCKHRINSHWKCNSEEEWIKIKNKNSTV